MFSINTNISSLEAQNYLAQSSQFQSQTINEVTSGLRIVNSGDDAAGLAVANGLRSDQAVLNQGIQNANNGLATLQTIDSGMNNIGTLLDRARTLATESASGTFTGDRSTLNSEFQSVISEISRQAQSIGMNQGGQFAQDLSVFIGGGKGATSAAATQNGTIDLNLSQSAVDAQSLGLQGVQATGMAGTDISTGSANTSVSQILANAANVAGESSPGSTTFTFSGPGFGDANRVSVSVNLSGVSDPTSLVSAINQAIQAAGDGATPQATAFKNANISASVVTDSQGREQLAFSSSNAAFQVQAGDQMANALMGNFAQNASLTGSDNNAAVSNTGLSFSSLDVNGSAVNLSSTTQTALAGGAIATSGGVSGLATVSDATIAALNSNTGLAASDTLALTVNGVAQTVTFKGGETSLSQIASEITNANIGVTASVKNAGTTSEQLVLTSNATGSTSNVSVQSTGTSSELLALGVTGFTATTNGTAGTNGASTVATSGSVTGNSLTTASNTSSITTLFSGGGGTLVLNVNGSTQSVSIASATTTLSGIATQITNAGVGVTASVSTSGSTEQLTLTSNATGSTSSVGVVTNGTTSGLPALLGITGATSGSVQGTATISTAGITAAITGGQTLALNVDGTKQTITFSNAITTIAGLVNAINAAGVGVTASSTGASPNSQLTLTSNTTGTSSDVSILGTSGGTSAALLGATVTGFTAATAGTAGSAATYSTSAAGQNAASAPTKGQIVAALNADSNFSGVATASLDGNQVVIKSNLNSASSSVQATGTLATALGFSSTAATAASASTGASLATTVQSSGILGNIDQAVVSSSTAPTTGTINSGSSNNVLSIQLGTGTAVNLTIPNGTGYTNASVAQALNVAIADSTLAGQVTASTNSNGNLVLSATNPGTTVTVAGDAATNLGFTSGQTSGTASDPLVTSNENIQVQFSGAGMASPVTLSLNATTAGVTKVSDVITDLTSQIGANSALAAAGITVSSSTIGNNLVFTDSNGDNFNVAVTGDTSNILGFGSFATGSANAFQYSSVTGSTNLPTTPTTNIASNGSLNISLNGGSTLSSINVALKSTSAVLVGNAVSDATVAGVHLTTNDSLQLQVNGTTVSHALAGGETSLTALASEISGWGIGVTADVVGSGPNQQLRLTNSTTGGSVTVMSGTNNGVLTATGLTVGQTATGLSSAAAVQQDAVNQINSAIADSSTLTAAGLQASMVGGKLELSSTNGTEFRVSGSGPANLGFGTSGGTYTGTTVSAAPTGARFDSQGAYTSSAMAFKALANGGDSQTVSITATDSSGDDHSLAVTLSNNATSTNGSNIDSTLDAINTALQQSDDPTLQSIYAVKEDVNGQQEIKFMSTTQNFKVAVSSTNDGTGIAAPTGGVSTSVQNGTGSSGDISTQAGAEAAVNALATAVQNLGTAQAAVGKGENLLNYAISLATSQTTNEAAAESQIRDANLAQEAANLTRAQILVQAGTAALAQANSAPQQLLSLLQH